MVAWPSGPGGDGGPEGAGRCHYRLMHFADIPSRHARGRGPTVKLRSRLMEKCPMNLKTTTLVLIMTGIGVLAGCSSPSVGQTRDGGQVVTPDEPQTDRQRVV